MRTLTGSIEAGGTKFVCAIGSGPDNLVISQIVISASDGNWPHIVVE